MASRAGALADHLPSLYREGPLLNGLFAGWGVQIDLLDEAAQRVQRARWIDTTLRLDEAAALAAVLDVAPEAFHADLDEFRAWVHSLRDARLQAGAVTREAIRIFVDGYLRGFQAASAIDLVPAVPTFATSPGPDRVALVENPRRLRHARLPDVGGLEPLARAGVENRGLDPAPPALVVTSLGSAGGEFAPMLANLTTGQAVVWLGHVPPGQRLTIAASSSDPLQLAARLEGADVSDRLRVVPDLRVGAGGPGVYASDRPVPRLAVGPNDLWFLPLAHYDTPGLDRVLLAMADLMLHQGRWDETRFDHSLFFLPAAATVQVAWIEHVPATFEVDLPAHTLESRAGELADALAAADRLETGLGEGVGRLAAAGVDGRVRLAARHERQPANDRMVAVLPMTIRETGSTGGDRLAESAGAFDVTAFDDSTMT